MRQNVAHRPTALTPWSGELLDDLLVTGAQFRIPMRLLLDDGADPVVLTRVGRDITEDAQLGDVGIVFWVDAFELWMESSVPSTSGGRRRQLS